MAIRIVRLGSKRHRAEGLRIGTVRRPPRGVPKERFSEDDWYDVWLPQLAPSAELVEEARGAETPADWKAFARRFRSEMSSPDNARLIDLLAALSHRVDFSVGCYCENEERCHRSVLRQLLADADADLP
jgi:uncharacterized protein YeaO (DUF488 family)